MSPASSAHNRGDRARRTAVLTAATAMIGIPLLGPLIAGTTEGAEEFDTEITPPDYAFVIWAPIFAATAANAIQHAANPSSLVNRRTGWWLAAGYAANALWSVAAQSGRFRYTPYILPTAAALTGIGFARAQHPHPQRPADQLPATSAGLLLGWISAASTANIFATRQPATTRQRAQAASAAAAAALTGVVAAARHGSTAVAASAGWAYLTSATNPKRTRTTRAISAAGAAALAAAALAPRR